MFDNFLFVENEEGFYVDDIVEINNDLDFAGAVDEYEVGINLGLNLSEEGHLTMIRLTAWQGYRNRAFYVSYDEAIEEMKYTGNLGLLDEFPDVKRYYEENYQS